MNHNFLKAMSAAGGVYEKKVTKQLVQTYVDVLEPRDLDLCATAIKTHMTNSVYFPKPADIINLLEEDDASGVESAWNQALASQLWDERLTVILPKAIFRSFPFSVWPDRVAARMAFKEAYPDKLKEYGNQVEVSLGFDTDGRLPAIQSAVNAGLLEYAHAQHLLEDHTITTDVIVLPDMTMNKQLTKGATK